MFRAKTMLLALLAYNILPVLPVSAATEAIIYSFSKQPDGINPEAGLLNVKGTLFGTTTSGGTGSDGTVFSITPAGKENVLYSFTGSDGAQPRAPLLQVGDALYGTTTVGGAHGGGTVFKISAQGGVQIVYSFGSNAGDGIYPSAALIEVGGALYGTTQDGGSGTGGTVFKITLSGQETTLHSFGDCAPSLADGCIPEGRLLYVDGALFGTTNAGGFGQGGVVFRLNGNSETIVHGFGPGAGGKNPHGGLINVNGVLYGTTALGGRTTTGEPTDAGTVYSIDQSGHEKLVYTFDKSGNAKNDGVFPVGELLYINGILFGLTESGGYHQGGTAYALQLDGSRETVLCNLRGGPFGSLIALGDKLYGTTAVAGAHHNGTVFSIAP